ncbi:MAG: FAD-dependent oxidoreductase [bacterium]|nr:FAD-dependent oxidoreductase [bacterium]
MKQHTVVLVSGTFSMTEQHRTIAIIGGGILGTMLAYELSFRTSDVKIIVLEKEDDVARHTSGRNTGVLHRPFYCDPKTKKKFAQCAKESYGFWKAYAEKKYLPWKEVGTIEVAFDAAGVQHLQQYKQWSLQNGMRDDEVRLLTPEEVRAIEPNVRCAGALLCSTDTAVDFGAFTRALKDDAMKNGVEFLFGCEVKEIIEKKDEIEIRYRRFITPLTSSYNKRGVDRSLPLKVRGSWRGLHEEGLRVNYLVNCAGGNALRIAHMMGVAREYADVNFRGEYRIVEGKSARLASRNIYTVPRHSAFPFLDPHYVVRADGRVEIGPTAVPVFGAYAYRGFGESARSAFQKMCERPLINKLRLFTNLEFLTLCAQEWKSALSCRTMVRRVQKFLPALDIADCRSCGNAGVRASLIDRNGRFVPEAIEISGSRSLHILNYNSPGATGAPAYARLLTGRILSDKI